MKARWSRSYQKKERWQMANPLREAVWCKQEEEKVKKSRRIRSGRRAVVCAASHQLFWPEANKQTPSVGPWTWTFQLGSRHTVPIECSAFQLRPHQPKSTDRRPSTLSTHSTDGRLVTLTAQKSQSAEQTKWLALNKLSTSRRHWHWPFWPCATSHHRGATAWARHFPPT